MFESGGWHSWHAHALHKYRDCFLNDVLQLWLCLSSVMMSKIFRTIFSRRKTSLTANLKKLFLCTLKIKPGRWLNANLIVVSSQALFLMKLMIEHLKKHHPSFLNKGDAKNTYLFHFKNLTAWYENYTGCPI